MWFCLKPADEYTWHQFSEDTHSTVLGRSNEQVLCSLEFQSKNANLTLSDNVWLPSAFSQPSVSESISVAGETNQQHHQQQK